VSLAARNAFARGDYMAVIKMIRRVGDDAPAAAKLLLAQSYARIGADGLAANTASKAITAILADTTWSGTEPPKGFSALETRALRSWLVSLDSIDKDPNKARLPALRDAVLDRTSEVPEESVHLGGELDEVRQRVAAKRTVEQAATSKYRLINLIAGTLAGGLAATSGVVGVAKGPWAVIAIFAFASAAITAALTALKPAEREKESKVRADALGQLAASIDLFDVDRSDATPSLLAAVKEAHERLSVAEGQGKIAPLVGSPKFTAGPAITSISPAEGPIEGGQDLTITGTGFTGATGVRFGTKPALSCDVVSDAQINAKSPEYKAATVNVTVTGPGGKSPISQFSRYKYVSVRAATVMTSAGPEASETS
jgi:hypothetical protein